MTADAVTVMITAEHSQNRGAEDVVMPSKEEWRWRGEVRARRTDGGYKEVEGEAKNKK